MDASNSSIGGFPRPYGKFELLRPLGDGGMAEVFLARLPGVAGFQKTLVLKRILPHLARRKHFVDLFVAEARLAAEVRHRNVVQVYELGQVEGELYMAMEYVEGQDLRRLLRYAGKERLRIPPWFTVHVLTEVLEALSYAYDLRDEEGRPRRVVHRDVTPSNIFISNQGEVKLGDFGVAKDDTRSQQTRAGQLKGKVAYMAPEQLYSRPVDQRVDVFAVGVVMWECLAQRRLFGGRPDIEMMNLICSPERPRPSEHSRDIPPDLDAAVLKAIAPDPDARFASAAEMQRALYAVLGQMRPRVTSADVREVQRGLTKEVAPPAVGIGGLDRLRPASGTSDSIHSFTGLSAGEESSDGSREPVLANPAYANGDSIADLSIDLDLGAASLRSSLADDLGMPAAVPARAGAPIHLSSQSGLHPEPRPAPPRPESGAGRVLRGLPTAPMPVVRGQVVPPPAAEPVPLDLDALIEDPEPLEPDALIEAPALDMDALVQEAVDSVRAEVPDAPAVHQSSLIAGLDSRRLLGETRTSSSDRWAFVLDREVYSGAHPFFLVDHEGSAIGPCSYEQALTIVKLEAKAGFADKVRVGVEADRYISGRTMLELLGMRTLVRSDPPDHEGMIDSEGRSPIRAFADFTRRPFSGRLILFRDRNVRTDYREIEILGGEPTFVWTEDEELQYPSQLVHKRLLRAPAVAEMAHLTVASRQPLEQVVSRRLGTDLARYRTMLLKERLVDLFARGFASYTVRERADLVHTESFAPNLLQVALELTFRAIPRMQVESHVAPYLRRKLRPAPDFDRMMGQLSLTPDILQATSLLTKGKPLERLLDAHRAQRRSLTTLTFFCMEARLLDVEL